MKDDLGDRMKKSYEDRTRYSLPRRTYTILRLDGKAFHTFTQGMEKPFDLKLSRALDAAAARLCIQAMVVKFAYLQSDEMSFLLTDFEKTTTEPWFDGNIQKICSVAASIVSVEFNEHFIDNPQAYFDARVFTIPDPIEVENYFIWRQKDCMRNSISMIAQRFFSHKDLQGVNQEKMYEMLIGIGVDYRKYPERDTVGRIIVKEDGYFGGINPDTGGQFEEKRSQWVIKDAPIFTLDRSFLGNLIPRME
jgi:tRNA(His) guanylyltransferase